LEHQGKFGDICFQTELPLPIRKISRRQGLAGDFWGDFPMQTGSNQVITRFPPSSSPKIATHTGLVRLNNPLRKLKSSLKTQWRPRKKQSVFPMIGP
jgi:hypothetical protein